MRIWENFKRLLNAEKMLETKKEELERMEVNLSHKKKIITEKDIIIKERENIILEKESLIGKKEETIAKIIEGAHEEAIHHISELINKKEILEKDNTKIIKEYDKTVKKIKKLSNEIMGINSLIEKFPYAVDYKNIEEEIENLSISIQDGFLKTIVELDFHHKDSKLLRRDMRANDKEITKLLESSASKYTTKANKTIYSLMVIGLRAELQNILYTLSYVNLDIALGNGRKLIDSYLVIAGQGNASILPTITKFLSELKPLFKKAIEIEYRYYIQKEKEKEEQRIIKEQMKQEAGERKLLEAERKKIEAEEGKYLQEISNSEELLKYELDAGKIAQLEAKIAELKGQVDKIEEQKEEIVKRANGKAGYVYVISNMGSFGDMMFKVGMTRRFNPQDRVDELGDASVPFKFDVHAMVFSNDAIGLENSLHKMLEEKRVNKINLRKEFFYSTINELEELIQEIDPTLEFVKTMKASEYRQSQSMKKEMLAYS
ncbi:GIY-YIG nuclease family protein [Peribacillus sp. NPDC097675]|uniref:GIY-YIG nuclease family protein n=1 Tax=Peribacillus sp. NPDC097675 TaxID=3390618 RepID=UPI003D04CDE2